MTESRLPQADPCNPVALQGMRVGIIGGGQLGRMLCQAATRLGVQTTVLTPDADCPAADLADRLIVADYSDVAAAEALAASSDCTTFEIETVAPQVLDRLAVLSREGRINVTPDPLVMRCIQDKSAQKAWLVRNGLPTNRFLVWNGQEPDPIRLSQCFGLPLVQKALTGGYDGRGVQILRSRTALSRLWRVPSLIEAFLPAVRELAVIVARDTRGEVRVYDPVELEFLPDANILDRVIAPARIDRELRRRAMGIARATASRLGTAGVFAIELFAMRDDSLLINEISPRVHNSGHHTIEACRTSQFEQHLRAVLGGTLGPVDLISPAITQNILNEPGREVRIGAGSSDCPDGTFVHWYGKRPDRPWRKLGHVTCLTEDPATARARTEAALSGSTDVTVEACA